MTADVAVYVTRQKMRLVPSCSVVLGDAVGWNSIVANSTNGKTGRSTSSGARKTYPIRNTPTDDKWSKRPLLYVAGRGKTPNEITHTSWIRKLNKLDPKKLWIATDMTEEHKASLARRYNGSSTFLAD